MKPEIQKIHEEIQGCIKDKDYNAALEKCDYLISTFPVDVNAFPFFRRAYCLHCLEKNEETKEAVNTLSRMFDGLENLPPPMKITLENAGIDFKQYT